MKFKLPVGGDKSLSWVIQKIGSNGWFILQQSHRITDLFKHADLFRNETRCVFRYKEEKKQKKKDVWPSMVSHTWEFVLCI